MATLMALAALVLLSVASAAPLPVGGDKPFPTWPAKYYANMTTTTTIESPALPPTPPTVAETAMLADMPARIRIDTLAAGIESTTIVLYDKEVSYTIYAGICQATPLPDPGPLPTPVPIAFEYIGLGRRLDTDVEGWMYQVDANDVSTQTIYWFIVETSIILVMETTSVVVSPTPVKTESVTVYTEFAERDSFDDALFEPPAFCFASTERSAGRPPLAAHPLPTAAHAAPPLLGSVFAKASAA